MAVPGADPVAVVEAELAHFLDCIRTGREPDAGLAECGVGLALVLDAARRSAADATVTKVGP